MTTQGQVRLSFPSWKVFLFGCDVTEDVSSVVTNWSDARSPASCEIVLSSVLDKYMCTVEDIFALYGDISVEDLSVNSAFQLEETLLAIASGEEAKTQFAQDNIDTFIRERLTKTVKDDVKRRVFNAKFGERFKNKTQPSVADGLEEALTSLKGEAKSSALLKKTSIHKFAALTGDFLRFPFQVGQPIFHPNDAVRVFLRDPYRANDWYFAFTGFVSDWKETMDANGRRTVSIMAEDALRMFARSRVVTNWALYDVDAVEDKEHDFAARTWYADNFSDLTLPEVLLSMTFGVAQAGPVAQSTLLVASNGKTDRIAGINSFDYFHYGVNDKRTSKASIDGIGVFNFEGSKLFEIGPQANTTGFEDLLGFVGLPRLGSKDVEHIETLGDWQRQIDHKVSVVIDDVISMCIPSERVNQALLLLGASDDGEHTDIDLVMKEIGEHPELYPVDFGRLMVLMPSTLGPGTNRDILLRDLVNGIANQTEYITRLAVIYNIVQRIDFSFYATPRGDVVCEMPLYSFRPEDFGEDYVDRYTFPLQDTISLDSHFSDSKVRTQFRMPFWTIANLTSTGNSDQLWQIPGTATLRSLVPAFGVRMETGDPWGFIHTREAAAYMANVRLMQLNADAWTQNISTSMHIGVGPNRPCHFEARDFIATVRSISNSIVWGQSGSVGQTLKLNYRRGWSGLMTSDGKRHVYESFGGRASQPLDYSLLFQQASNASSTSSKQADPPKSSATSKSPSDIAEASDAEKLKGITDLADSTKVRLEELGVENVTINSVFRSAQRESDPNSQFHKNLVRDAANGDADAANALRFIAKGVHPHADYTSFDIGAGNNHDMYAKLEDMKKDNFFPKGTILHAEFGRNHVHVQLPAATTHLQRWGEDE